MKFLVAHTTLSTLFFTITKPICSYLYNLTLSVLGLLRYTNSDFYRLILSSEVKQRGTEVIGNNNRYGLN